MRSVLRLHPQERDHKDVKTKEFGSDETLNAEDEDTKTSDDSDYFTDDTGLSTYESESDDEDGQDSSMRRVTWNPDTFSSLFPQNNNNTGMKTSSSMPNFTSSNKKPKRCNSAQFPCFIIGNVVYGIDSESDDNEEQNEKDLNHDGEIPKPDKSEMAQDNNITTQMDNLQIVTPQIEIGELHSKFIEKKFSAYNEEEFFEELDKLVSETSRSDRLTRSKSLQTKSEFTPFLQSLRESKEYIHICPWAESSDNSTSMTESERENKHYEFQQVLKSLRESKKYVQICPWEEPTRISTLGTESEKGEGKEYSQICPWEEPTSNSRPTTDSEPKNKHKTSNSIPKSKSLPKNLLIYNSSNKEN